LPIDLQPQGSDSEISSIPPSTKEHSIDSASLEKNSGSHPEKIENISDNTSSHEVTASGNSDIYTPSIIIREQKNLQSNPQHEGASIDSTLSRISNSEASAKAHKSEQISIDQKVTRNQMVEQGLIQELTEFIIEESIEIKKSFYLNDKKTVTVQSLVHLYQKASLAEKNTIQAKQEEILCWYYYGKDFEKMVSEILSNPLGIGAENLSSDFSLSPKIEHEVSENK
ncbi:10126_t:CDS:2, partial [Diversispora eburnea]